MLSPIVRDYITSITRTTNAHPIMIMSAVLATVSAFAKGRMWIPEGTYFQNLYPNLWLLNITQSGQFKSTALMKGVEIATERSEKITQALYELKKQALKTMSEEQKKQLQDDIHRLSLGNVLLPNKITPEGFLEHLGQGHGGTHSHE